MENIICSLPLPYNFNNLSYENKTKVIHYLNQLDNFERKAYTIGLEHLGSSFNIIKSNGYIEWDKKQKNNT
jgi:hypothetical protein